MEAQICRNCKVFFGNQDGLCSKCLKESNPPSTPRIEISMASTPFLAVVEETKVEPHPQNPDKCSFCSKKLGPLNFLCKCSHYFCTKHRHPEEHQCTFDHRSAGIRKLSEENPLVQAPKFNKL